MFGKTHPERRHPASLMDPPKELAGLLSADFDKLLEAQRFIEREIAKRTEKELDATKNKLSAMASALGTSVGALFGFAAVGKSDRKRKKREGKVYINPDNASETYRGKGKRPAWLDAKLAAGHTLEEFLAQPKEAPPKAVE